MVNNLDKISIRCPHCNAHLRVTPNKYTQIVCPKCKGQVVLSGNPTDAMKPAVDRWGDEVGSEKGSEVHGFFDYLTRHWSQTHGDRIFPVFFSLLAAVAMSFLKPIIHLRGMGYALVLLLVTWVLATTLYALKRLLAYYVKGERTIDEEASSTLAWVAYSAFGVILFSWLPVLIAESFSPPHGWLTTLIPVLSEPQDRLIALLRHEPAKSPEGAERLIVKANSAAAVEAVEAEHPAKERAKTEAEPTEAADDEPSEPRKKRTKTHVEPSESTQMVVGEGVGASPQEALKDAFRNAVRQVVGAVVDAETLVKNDELIDDKVLTYSDGFIKSYDEVAGSKKVQSGLHRIKIKANVERRSVVAKLKAANVTVKEVKGKGLFAEVVTQLDAEQNAAQLLKRQLEGFPQSCITASVVGKPEIAEKTADSATIRYTVQVEPDLKAYKAFAERLKAVLEKMSKDQGEFTGIFLKQKSSSRDESSDSDFEYFAAAENANGICGNYGLGDLRLLSAWMPKAFEGSTPTSQRLKVTGTTIALGTARTKAGDRIEYSYFICDNALRSELINATSRIGTVKVTLLDGDGQVVSTDRFVAAIEHSPGGSGDGYEGTLLTMIDKNIGLLFGNIPRYTNPYLVEPYIFLITPSFFRTESHFEHRTFLNITRKLKLSLEELKSITTIKCAITFDDSAFLNIK